MPPTRSQRQPSNVRTRQRSTKSITSSEEDVDKSEQRLCVSHIRVLSSPVESHPFTSYSLILAIRYEWHLTIARILSSNSSIHIYRTTEYLAVPTVEAGRRFSTEESFYYHKEIEELDKIIVWDRIMILRCIFERSAQPADFVVDFDSALCCLNRVSCGYRVPCDAAAKYYDVMIGIRFRTETDAGDRR